MKTVLPYLFFHLVCRGAVALDADSLVLPKIVYCTYSNDTGDCHPNNTISNSTFAFGQYSQNFFVVNRFEENIKLQCIAPYPVRWLAQHPIGNVSYISENEGNQQLGNPLTETSPENSKQTIVLRRFQKDYGDGKESNIFRCESFGNSSVASETYLRFYGALYSARLPLLDTRGFANDNRKTYFIINNRGKTSTKEAGFTIPCVAEEFYGNFTAKLLKSDRSIGETRSEQILHTICIFVLVDLTNKTEEIFTIYTDGCFECVCIAKTLCKEFGFCVDDKSSISPFNYPQTSRNEHETTGCMKAEVFGHIRNNSNYSTCDNDTVWIWENATHGIVANCLSRSGPLREKSEWKDFTWRKNEGWNSVLAEKVYETCLAKKEVKAAEYDPRVGYRMTKPPNFDSLYQCLSVRKDNTIILLHLAPIDSRQKVKAMLEYDDGDPGNQGISCYTKAGGNNLQLDVGKCGSIIECELKWKPLASDPFPVENGLNDGEMERVQMKQGSESYQPRFWHGYLHCWQVLDASVDEGDSKLLKYISESDYYFTGTDLKLHLLRESPIEAIIGIGMFNEFEQRKLRRFGRTYIAVCKISTFVLSRNIMFAVEYNNNSASSKLVQVGNRSLSQDAITKRITTSVEEKHGIEAVQLRVRLPTNATKVSCYAPWMNSTNWARADAIVDSNSDAQDKHVQQTQSFYSTDGEKLH